MTVIELGDVTSGSPPAEPARRRGGPFHLRRYAVAAVAALCVLTVTGSARPDPQMLRTVWSVSGQPDDSLQVTADMVYVFGTSSGSSIRAYDAARGELLWSRKAPGQNGWIHGEQHGVVLLPSAEPQVTAPGPEDNGYDASFAVQTVAVDQRTGAELWQQRGEPSWATPDTLLLTEWAFRGGGLRKVRLVRLRDGTTVWSWTPEQRVVNWTVVRATQAIVTAGPDGRIEVRRLSDGTVTARGRVPWLLSRDSDGAFTDLHSQGDTLFVARSGNGNVTVNAYAAGTLQPRWEAPATAFTGMVDCRPLMCFGGRPRGLVGRDPLTGAIRWRAEKWDNAHALPDGRLLLQANDTGRSALADAVTGRILADLATRPAVLDTETGTVLTFTPTLDPPGRYAVREFDVAGRGTLRGTLAGIGGCQVAGRYLTCLDQGTLTVRAFG
ncbi:outer membrane protein assembly factor BamB family protein [Jidongwangia harbinensis]|uniref:outer membrane protein assembly factor BamB family protein n=1 Tax=Jidongwangia harbinensis TaxID=2878561 RepID=UPI001CD9D02E|nr:PQQ-binding-like beta-propeller repeat protein [Jidongwangia harbinensis]MCA2213542.1 hypothetical protein [Jidongwangia harbinensis]